MKVQTKISFIINCKKPWCLSSSASDRLNLVDFGCLQIYVKTFVYPSRRTFWHGTILELVAMSSSCAFKELCSFPWSWPSTSSCHKSSCIGVGAKDTQSLLPHKESATHNTQVRQHHFIVHYYLLFRRPGFKLWKALR